MKSYVGHRSYDRILVNLLREIASYRLREELLLYFGDELMKISSAGVIIILERYNRGEHLELFKIWDKNIYRNLKRDYYSSANAQRVTELVEDGCLRDIEKSRDAYSYHSSSGMIDFLSFFIPPSEFRRGGWATMVYLPRATPKHPDRIMVLWYSGYNSIQKIPTTITQDERVLYLFGHYYELASFNIKSKAKLIYEQRMEMLKALVPSMITHEIFHRSVTLYTSVQNLKKRIGRIAESETLEEAHLETAKLLSSIEEVVEPTLETLTDITRAISKLTKQATTEEVDIAKVLHDAVLIANVVATRLGIKITIDSPPSPIHTDRALLMHLVMNLVTNSIEAYRDIETSPKIIHIKVDNSDEKHLLIRVSDNARGIDPAVVDRLFEEGYTTKEEGNGLGLPICSYIAGFLGGKIELENYKRYKTTFTLTLPRDAMKLTTLTEEAK